MASPGARQGGSGSSLSRVPLADIQSRGSRRPSLAHPPR